MKKLCGEKLEKELARLDGMKKFERKYSGMAYIAGLDEAGRGPLAGPVVAAACILPIDSTILYLNDSKKLSPKRREELFPEIKEKAIAYGIGIIDAGRIDEINVLQADYEAMKGALRQISTDFGITPDVLLNDAVTIPGIDIQQENIIKGDSKSVSIAAASILAKVTRDHIMDDYDAIYPEYGFAKHKGYGTKQHIETLKKYGPCPIHRKTFIRNFI